MIRDVARWEAFRAGVDRRRRSPTLPRIFGWSMACTSCAHARKVHGRRRDGRNRGDHPRGEGASTVFEELLKRLAVALEKAALPYMVFGGQAVLRVRRTTSDADIDITVGVDPSQPAPVPAADRGACNCGLLVRWHDRVLSRPSCFRYWTRNPGSRIDFVFSLTEYERQAIEREQSRASRRRWCAHLCPSKT